MELVNTAAAQRPLVMMLHCAAPHIMDITSTVKTLKSGTKLGITTTPARLPTARQKLQTGHLSTKACDSFPAKSLQTCFPASKSRLVLHWHAHLHEMLASVNSYKQFLQLAQVIEKARPTQFNLEEKSGGRKREEKGKTHTQLQFRLQPTQQQNITIETQLQSNPIQ